MLQARFECRDDIKFCVFAHGPSIRGHGFNAPQRARITLSSLASLATIHATKAGVIPRSVTCTNVNNAVTLPGFARVDAVLLWDINENFKAQLDVETIFDIDDGSTAHSRGLLRSDQQVHPALSTGRSMIAAAFNRFTGSIRASPTGERGERYRMQRNQLPSTSRSRFSRTSRSSSTRARLARSHFIGDRVRSSLLGGRLRQQDAREQSDHIRRDARAGDDAKAEIKRAHAMLYGGAGAVCQIPWGSRRNLERRKPCHFRMIAQKLWRSLRETLPEFSNPLMRLPNH